MRVPLISGDNGFHSEPPAVSLSNPFNSLVLFGFTGLVTSTRTPSLEFRLDQESRHFRRRSGAGVAAPSRTVAKLLRQYVFITAPGPDRISEGSKTLTQHHVHRERFCRSAGMGAAHCGRPFSRSARHGRPACVLPKFRRPFFVERLPVFSGPAMNTHRDNLLRLQPFQVPKKACVIPREPICHRRSCIPAGQAVGMVS